MNERKVVGSSYIINFFQSIHNLTDYSCQYTNLLLEMKTKHGDEPDIKKMPSEELNILATVVQTVRYHAKVFYIQYKSIMPSLNMAENKKIDEYYKEIIKIYILPEELLNKFVTEANKILLNSVIKDLLVTSQNLLNQIYAAPEKEEGESGESS